MSKTFRLFGKNITVSTKTENVLKNTYGIEPFKEQVLGKIELYYGDDIFTGEKGLTVEEAIASHSEEELSKVVSKLIIQDVTSDDGTYVSSDDLEKMCKEAGLIEKEQYE